ncbi:MAG TPA: hypothetical protein VND64_35750 [Pirellulales bacterium]|nr:hypothetical protein [Pirellulales bacterium]
MRPRSGAFSRYRPRILTLIVLFVVAAPTVLANLSFEIPPDHGLLVNVSYGWPLIWHWYNLVLSPIFCGIRNWDYSVSRLAGNLAMWLVMLATAGGSCEWLLRRYRPRLRWSLRTMLAAVGLVAVCCAWFAAARDRANVQDPIIAAIEGREGDVWVERWGPIWLDFIGADRYRRCIIGVQMHGEELDEEFVMRLTGLPRLQYLEINVEQLTPRMAAALADMRQLRSLGVTGPMHDEKEFLAAIGQMTQLVDLQLQTAMIASESLESLAGLTNLKLLSLSVCTEVHEPGPQQPEGNQHAPLFTHLPALPRLEAIDFCGSTVSAQDLRHLAVLRNLKALDLSSACLSPDASLADLASLESLELLAIDHDMISASGIESLVAIKRLKFLIIHQFFSHGESDRLVPLALDAGDELFVADTAVDALRRALEALRHSNPGIVIDKSWWVVDRRVEIKPPWEDDAKPDRDPLAHEFPRLREFYRSQRSQGRRAPVQSAQEDGESGDE